MTNNPTPAERARKNTDDFTRIAAEGERLGFDMRYERKLAKQFAEKAEKEARR